MTNRTYISLLRGINVSGQKKIKMVDLCALYESLGFEKVISYIQSGNLMFSSSLGKIPKIRELIETAIKNHYDFDVPVEIRTTLEFKKIVDQLPFDRNQANLNGTQYLVTFLSDVPEKDKVKQLQTYVLPPEKLMVLERQVYLHCPGGYGKSKLTNTFIEKKLGVGATTRNWKTVTTLCQL